MGAGASRDGARAYSTDLEQYQCSKAIRPVGKLGQAMPAAEAAALLAAVSVALVILSILRLQIYAAVRALLICETFSERQ